MAKGQTRRNKSEKYVYAFLSIAEVLERRPGKKFFVSEVLEDLSKIDEIVSSEDWCTPEKILEILEKPTPIAKFLGAYDKYSQNIIKCTKYKKDAYQRGPGHYYFFKKYVSHRDMYCTAYNNCIAENSIAVECIERQSFMAWKDYVDSHYIGFLEKQKQESLKSYEHCEIRDEILDKKKPVNFVPNKKDIYSNLAFSYTFLSAAEILNSQPDKEFTLDEIFEGLSKSENYLICEENFNHEEVKYCLAEPDFDRILFHYDCDFSYYYEVEDLPVLIFKQSDVVTFQIGYRMDFIFEHIANRELYFTAYAECLKVNEITIENSEHELLASWKKHIDNLYEAYERKRLEEFQEALKNLEDDDDDEVVDLETVEDLETEEVLEDDDETFDCLVFPANSCDNNEANLVASLESSECRQEYDDPVLARALILNDEKSAREVLAPELYESLYGNNQPIEIKLSIEGIREHSIIQWKEYISPDSTEPETKTVYVHDIWDAPDIGTIHVCYPLYIKNKAQAHREKGAKKIIVQTDKDKRELIIRQVQETFKQEKELKEKYPLWSGDSALNGAFDKLAQESNITRDQLNTIMKEENLS